MAAIAGKVAITPKGEWDVATQYEKLDFVLHGDDSYVARKASLGVEPGTDDETWQLSLRGASSQQINDILDGTTPVGDSNSLGGETAAAWQDEIDAKLDKSGGTITAVQTMLLDLNSTTDQNPQSWLGFSHKGSRLGFTGFNRDGNMQVSKDGINFNAILHTGNKPTGTYTGNGKSRTIEIGGVGHVVCIRSANGLAIISADLVVTISTNGSVSTSKTNAAYNNGQLNLYTVDSMLNADGVTYAYQVL